MFALTFTAGVVLLVSGCADTPLAVSEVSERLNDRTGYQFEQKSDPKILSLPPGIDLEAGVTETDAVRLALWNNAGFRETLTDLGLAQADLIRAETLPNPNLATFLPLGPKQLEFTIRYPLEALWLRPKRIDAAELELERVSDSLVQNGLDVIRDVKVAMADLRLAKQRLQIAGELADVLKQSAMLADAQFRAGDVSELDVATVTNDAVRATVEASLLDYDVTVVHERMRLLTGLGFHAVKFVEPQTYTPPTVIRCVEQLLQDALAARPDLRAAEIAIEVAGKNAGLAESEIYTLTGLFDANSIGSENMFESGPGFELPIPIFDRNQAGIARAKTQLERASRRYVTIRDQIAMEIRQSYARYRQAKTGLQGWRDRLMRPLEKTMQQATKAYSSGETSLLPVLEATRNLVDAKRREAESIAGLRQAIAELERSLGGRLDLRAPLLIHE